MGLTFVDNFFPSVILTKFYRFCRVLLAEIGDRRILQTGCAAKGMEKCQMSEALWKKGESIGAQPTPTWATYVEAMDRFSRSATAFMEHVYLLTEARAAFQEAMSVGTELRNRLDAGDQTLRSLMNQLEQVVRDHLSGPMVDRKKPELVKGESITGQNQSTRTERSFP
jgi:hypothetical protein